MYDCFRNIKFGHVFFEKVNKKSCTLHVALKPDKACVGGT